MARTLSAALNWPVAFAVIASSCGGNPAGPTKSNPDLPPPVISALGVSPALGVLGVTTFTLSAEAIAQPGTTVTFAWDLGDGNRATGATIVKAYDRARSYDVILSITALRADGSFAGSATSHVTVPVVLLTGTWSDKQLLRRTELHLTQDGSRLTGSYTTEPSLPILGPARKWIITAAAPGRVDPKGAFELPLSPYPENVLYGELRSSKSAAYGYVNGSLGLTFTKTSDSP